MHRGSELGHVRRDFGGDLVAEIALRRLRERLLPAASTLALLLWLALPLVSAPVHAQDAQTVAEQAGDAEEDEDSAEEPATAANDPANTPAMIFGTAPVDTAGFRQAVNRAYEDPLQRPTRQVTRWKPIEQATMAYGYGLFTGGLGAHYGAERLGCRVIPMSGGQTEKQVQLITDFKPDIIMVTPSYMQVIVEEFVRQGLDPVQSSLKVGIFGAEPWTEAMRREIEGKAGIDAVDIYGLSEVMGPGVASECIESKDGPVIWEDHFYPEIIDPETGEVLPDGSEGELVFTTLTKEALPVIRYRTRDLTRLLPPTSRSFRRIGKIVGRSDDMLIIRGVNVFPTQIEEIVLAHPQLSGQYQIQVSREGPLDKVGVRCELQPGVVLSQTEHQAVADWVSHRIKTLVGISTRVEVLPTDSIERTLVGKARRVFDLRKR